MRYTRGFTLIELLVTIAVLAILAALIYSGAPMVRDRFEAVRCAGNLKSIHIALANYVQDIGHWPQEPPGLWESNNNDAYEDWWIKELTPFGLTEKSWQCPTIVRRITNKSKDNRPKIHYTPTMFDEKPSTPYKWSTQPWVIEIGNMHGGGALISFPDGSIKSMSEVSQGM